MVVQSLIRDCLAQRTFWFRFIFLGLFVPCSLLVFPNRVAAVTFSAEVDRSRLSPGDQLTLKVTLEGSVQSLPTAELPTLNGVEVYTGGTSQNFSFINGKTSLSVTTTYYLVVRTDRSFEIPALEVEVQGQTYRTQPIPIQVIPTTSAPRGGDRQEASALC